MFLHIAQGSALKLENGQLVSSKFCWTSIPHRPTSSFAPIVFTTAAKGHLPNKMSPSAKISRLHRRPVGLFLIGQQFQ